MRLFAKLFCTVAVSALIGLLHSQDLIYTISGEFEGDKISLDSILIENLSNGTEILFSELLEQSEYKINLTTQELQNLTGINMFLMEDNFKLIRNTPGQLTINCLNRQIGSTHLNVYNIQGQKLHSTSFINVTKESSINIQLPVAGIYIIELKSQMGSVTYKGIGSNYYGGFSVTVDGKIPTHKSDLKSSLIKFVSDFNFGVGDSLRISAYKEDYYARPIIHEITGSTSIDFTFKVSSVVTEGISDAYISLDSVISDSILYDSSTGEVQLAESAETKEFQIGDIITIDLDTAGYLRKVVNSTILDGKVILETEQAYMNELFVDKEFTLSTVMIEPSAMLKSTSSTEEIASSLTDDNGYIHPVKIIYFDTEGNIVDENSILKSSLDESRKHIVDQYKDFSMTDLYGKEGDDIHFYISEGEIYFNTDAVFVFDFDYEGEFTEGTKIKKGDLRLFEFYLEASAGILTKVALDMSGAYDKADDPEYLFPIAYARAQFLVPPTIPVWIDFDLGMYRDITIHANASLNADWGFEINDTLKVGGRYTMETKELTPISEFKHHSEVYPLNIEGEINAFARLELYPRIDMKLYSIFGPYAEIVPYVEGKYNAALQTQITPSGSEIFLAYNAGIDLGLDLRVGAALNILGLNPDLGSKVVPLSDKPIPLWRSPYNIELLTDLPEVTTPGTELLLSFKVTDNLGFPEQAPVYIEGDGTFDKHLVVSDIFGQLIVHWTVGSETGSQSFAATIYNSDLSVISSVTETINVSAVIPQITTLEPNRISSTKAYSGGNITFDGGAPITARGVCWSTSQNPKISTNKTLNGSGVGEFESFISGLTPETTYYIRAYAINEAGVAYGNQKDFTTMKPATSPTVSTYSVNNIIATSATTGGNVTSDGGDPVIVKGVCYGKDPHPTTDDLYTTDGDGLGSFTSNLNDLEPNTTYYVRAYALNNIDWGYGNEVSFKTDPPPTVPTVSTNPIINIGTTSANSGGTIIATGGSEILMKGVCWSTSQNPTTDNPEMLTTNGSGSNSYSSYISGLMPNTTYYVRAYAINSSGTGYGNQRSFKTDPDGGTVTDIDGNVYKTVKIGDQVWMAENLKVTHYPDGTPIPNGAGVDRYYDNDDFWFVYNDNLSYEDSYGLLYTWSAATNGAAASSSIPSGVQGVCPSGWHLPSNAEYEQLIDFLGGESVAGGKLKEAGYSHWDSPNTGATNESGFTFLGTGYKDVYGDFRVLRQWGYAWTASENTSYYGAILATMHKEATAYPSYSTRKGTGCAVRCIKD